MESYAVPFRILAERAGWFVRDRSRRVFNVVTSGELRESVVEVLMAQEYHADNRSLFLSLDEPLMNADEKWDERAEKLSKQFSAWREEMVKAGHAVAPLSVPPPASKGSNGTKQGALRFAETVHRIGLAITAPLEGLVVILAPTQIEDKAIWSDRLKALGESSSLREVRWVVVDVDHSTVEPWIERLGRASMMLECKVDENAARADLEQKINAAAIASAEAPGPAQVGAAWPPNVTPPVAARPTLTPEQQAAVYAKWGVPAGIMSPRVREIRPLVLRAALAMRKMAPLEAVHFQSEACVIATEAGMLREAAVMELILATYVVHTGNRPRAKEMYNTLAARTAEREWFDLSAQALMAAAALHLIDQERDNAALLYASAGTTAKRGGQSALAIEAYRMAGQLRAEARDPQLAIRLWSNAMEVANAMPPPDAAQTSAPVAARALAAVCRKQGMVAQARSLEEQSDRMEAAART